MYFSIHNRKNNVLEYSITANRKNRNTNTNKAANKNIKNITQI